MPSRASRAGCHSNKQAATVVLGIVDRFVESTLVDISRLQHGQMGFQICCMARARRVHAANHWQAVSHDRIGIPIKACTVHEHAGGFTRVSWMKRTFFIGEPSVPWIQHDPSHASLHLIRSFHPTSHAKRSTVT